jgi:Stage II sporulation protein E (SpoIIE)
MVWLSGLVVAIAILSPIVGSKWIPPVVVVLPILAAGLLLGRTRLLVLIALSVAAVVYDTIRLDWRVVQPGAIFVVAAAAVFANRLARSRETLGVQGLRSESMLVDLRNRLRAQGEMPKLPAGWHSEIVLRSAGGAKFGGDFMVAEVTGEGRFLEVVVVDVSGKGVDAGTRALLLSGALGGLLGAVAPSEFLPAANDYLIRQEWDEGFATAVHIVIDLQTGSFVVESAGHPPSAQFIAGSGTWRLVEVDSPLLGVIPGASYTGTAGELKRGDAMLMYTDGLVEIPGRDLSVGIDKLVGEAERLVTAGFRDGARRLADAVAPGESDDCALVLIWRE